MTNENPSVMAFDISVFSQDRHSCKLLYVFPAPRKSHLNSRITIPLQPEFCRMFENKGRASFEPFKPLAGKPVSFRPTSPSVDNRPPCQSDSFSWSHKHSLHGRPDFLTISLTTSPSRYFRFHKHINDKLWTNVICIPNSVLYAAPAVWYISQSVKYHNKIYKISREPRETDKNPPLIFRVLSVTRGSPLLSQVRLGQRQSTQLGGYKSFVLARHIEAHQGSFTPISSDVRIVQLGCCTYCSARLMYVLFSSSDVRIVQLV
ncbi:hypothetical protein RRG08_040821 [Elysia crispata]|uniref:Uncharacterized protein n=1 Tax=Elysia crispata TaxID=231223 RepID=A0AAE1DCN6_9GAST|nr:hypothetical protein RRG08_040821 [Elysia crispata]